MHSDSKLSSTSRARGLSAAGFSRIGSLRALELSTALQLAALVKSSDDAVIVLSLDGRITSWSRGAERLFGYSQREAVGQRVTILSPPARRDEATSRLSRMLAGGGVERTDTERVAKDGRLLNVALVMSPINGPSGELIGIAAIARDTTAQTLAEEELQAARLEDLAHLALAAEYRDDGTHQHTERVATLAELIAARAGHGRSAAGDGPTRCSAARHRQARHPGPDPVEAGRPDRRRAGRDEDPHDDRRTHPGRERVPVLGMAREIALTHHERWDGIGYPAGLRASAIPIAGRIVAVADVFDAITHERPYKQALPADYAISEITRASGAQFDADVVDAFMACVGDVCG